MSEPVGKSERCDSPTPSASDPAALVDFSRSYRRWRSSRVGRTTDLLERELLFDLMGPVEGKRVLDVGCGDGDPALSLWRSGAEVTGLDSDRHMLAEAR